MKMHDEQVTMKIDLESKIDFCTKLMRNQGKRKIPGEGNAIVTEMLDVRQESRINPAMLQPRSFL